MSPAVSKSPGAAAISCTGHKQTLLVHTIAAQVILRLNHRAYKIQAPIFLVSATRESRYIYAVLPQVRSQAAIEQRMRTLTDGAGQRRADAFLCVSGSHPARRLPGSSR